MDMRNPNPVATPATRTRPNNPWPAEPRVDQVLAARPSRAPCLKEENRALCEMAGALARSDGDVLQQLVEHALKLCGAHSAGVSLLEMDGTHTVFRWHAVAGRWAGYRLGSMPRDASPCSAVVDHRAPQVMPRPEKYFPAMLDAVPLATEALLVPFEVLGETVGTVWVVSHEESLSFSAEDLRVMRSLAQFAAAGYVSQVMLRKALDDRDELVRTKDRLQRENARLWQKQEEKKGRDSRHGPSDSTTAASGF